MSSPPLVNIAPAMQPPTGATTALTCAPVLKCTHDLAQLRNPQKRVQWMVEDKMLMRYRMEQKTTGEAGNRRLCGYFYVARRS